MDLDDSPPAGLRERAKLALLGSEEASENHLAGIARRACQDILWEPLPETIEFKGCPRDQITFTIEGLNFRVRVQNVGKEKEFFILEVEGQVSTWSKVESLIDVGMAIRKMEDRPAREKVSMPLSVDLPT